MHSLLGWVGIHDRSIGNILTSWMLKKKRNKFEDASHNKRRPDIFKYQIGWGMGPTTPSELTYLVGFNYVAAEAASEYVLSSEKLNPECRLTTTWIRFPTSDSDISIRHTFFGRRESKFWKQEAESGKQETNHTQIGRRLWWSKWLLDHQRLLSRKGETGNNNHCCFVIPELELYHEMLMPGVKIGFTRGRFQIVVYKILIVRNQQLHPCKSPPYLSLTRKLPPPYASTSSNSGSSQPLHCKISDSEFALLTLQFSVFRFLFTGCRIPFSLFSFLFYRFRISVFRFP